MLYSATAFKTTINQFTAYEIQLFDPKAGRRIGDSLRRCRWRFLSALCLLPPVALGQVAQQTLWIDDLGERAPVVKFGGPGSTFATADLLPTGDFVSRPDAESFIANLARIFHKATDFSRPGKDFLAEKSDPDRSILLTRRQCGVRSPPLVK